MILRGVVESTFGGALCVRGFARIGDLAKISESKDYQRPLDGERVNNILEYLQNGSFRFFPELIFGIQLEGIDAIQNIRNGIKSELSEGIKLNLYRKDYADYEKSDKLESPLLRRVSFYFSNDSKKYLSRIDGNHRLSAVDEYLSQNLYNPETLNYYVPFCVILQSKTDEAVKYETAYFHLINSKSKQLTTEENLKSILSSGHFSDDEIEKIIGKNGVKAKKLIELINSYQFQGIGEIFEENYRFICLEIFNLLRSKNQDCSILDVQKAIQAIDLIFSEEEKLKKYKSIGILLAFIYYRLQSKPEFAHFKDWVIDNQIFDIPELTSISIVDIFNKIHLKKTYKVFVAMPYWSHPEINEYNKLFKEILTEVSKKSKTELELIPIMRFKGRSQRIDQRLLEKIEECDIFIANLTGCNENVIFEVGYAEGKNKHMILLKEEKDESLVPFDMDKLQWIPYLKETYYNAIKGIVSNNLIEILRKEYKVFI